MCAVSKVKKSGADDTPLYLLAMLLFSGANQVLPHYSVGLPKIANNVRLSRALLYLEENFALRSNKYCGVHVCRLVNAACPLLRHRAVGVISVDPYP